MNTIGPKTCFVRKRPKRTQICANALHVLDKELFKNSTFQCKHVWCAVETRRCRQTLNGRRASRATRVWNEWRRLSRRQRHRCTRAANSTTALTTKTTTTTLSIPSWYNRSGHALQCMHSMVSHSSLLWVGFYDVITVSNDYNCLLPQLTLILLVWCPELHPTSKNVSLQYPKELQRLFRVELLHPEHRLPSVRLGNTDSKTMMKCFKKSFVISGTSAYHSDAPGMYKELLLIASHLEFIGPSGKKDLVDLCK